MKQAGGSKRCACGALAVLSRCRRFMEGGVQATMTYVLESRRRRVY
jgi:hypothetical protein